METYTFFRVQRIIDPNFTLTKMIFLFIPLISKQANFEYYFITISEFVHI
jgi:hypothetical protein